MIDLHYTCEKMIPIHEYSSIMHNYVKLTFNNVASMNQYIQKFKNASSIVNCNNSYLADDESISSADIKLCREYQYSPVDWNIVKYYKKVTNDDVVIYFVSNILLI